MTHCIWIIMIWNYYVLLWSTSTKLKQNKFKFFLKTPIVWISNNCIDCKPLYMHQQNFPPQTSQPNAHSRSNYLWHKIQFIELFIKLISSLAVECCTRCVYLYTFIADLFSDSMACDLSLYYVCTIYANRGIDVVETAKILVILMKILVWS